MLNEVKNLCFNNLAFIKLQLSHFTFCFVESHFCNFLPIYLISSTGRKVRKDTKFPFYSLRSFAKTAQDDTVSLSF